MYVCMYVHILVCPQIKKRAIEFICHKYLFFSLIPSSLSWKKELRRAGIDIMDASVEIVALAINSETTPKKYAESFKNMKCNRCPTCTYDSM